MIRSWPLFRRMSIFCAIIRSDPNSRWNLNKSVSETLTRVMFYDDNNARSYHNINFRPDYILHLETFSEDLQHLLTDVGLSQHRHLFPHTHTQRGGHSSQLTESFISQLSSNQLLQLVDKYRLDLELFGYLWWSHHPGFIVILGNKYVCIQFLKIILESEKAGSENDSVKWLLWWMKQ